MNISPAVAAGFLFCYCCAMSQKKRNNAKKNKAKRLASSKAVEKRWPKSARTGDPLHRLGKSGGGRLTGKPKQAGLNDA